MADKLPVTTQSQPFPGSLTPGWNDPPLLNYVTQPPGRTRLNLSKRVAFPMHSISSSVPLDSSTVSTSFVQSKLSPVWSLPPNSSGKPMVNMNPNRELHAQMTEKPRYDTDSVNK